VAEAKSAKLSTPASTAKDSGWIGKKKRAVGAPAGRFHWHWDPKVHIPATAIWHGIERRLESCSRTIDSAHTCWYAGGLIGRSQRGGRAKASLANVPETPSTSNGGRCRAHGCREDRK